MQNFKLFVIIYFILFYSLSLAQTEQSSNSTKAEKNTGLVFEKQSEDRLDDSSYTDVIQLLSLTEKAQAIQFRILLNKSSDDSNILIFKEILKGTDLSDPSWLLDFNVIKAKSSTSNESPDEIYVLLYNSNLDGGLLPGNYSDLIKVKYKIAEIPDSKNNVKSSMKISNAEASTSSGNAIDIKPSHDELKIIVKNK